MIVPPPTPTLFFLQLRALDRHVPLEYIHSSNLLHLTAIIQSACQISNLVCVLQTFHYTLNNNTSKIVVDVVGDNGYCWIKVIARNPNSMNQAFHGKKHTSTLGLS